MKLRAAVVGVGYLGTFHAQKYKQLCEGEFQGRMEFVGVCDANRDQAQKVADELGVRAWSDPQEMMNSVDVVTVATVTSSHYQVARQFLEKGCHVNVEKPMTVNSSEAEELVRLAKKKNKILCVGHSERFNSSFQALKDQCDKPKWIEAHRHAPFKSRGADVSVIHDLMIHDVDLVTALVNSPCRVVRASGGKLLTQEYDWASAWLEFESGAKALVTCSRVAAAMTRQVKAVSDEKQFTADLQTGDLLITTPQRQSLTLEFQTKSCGKSDNLLAETRAYFRAVLGQAPPIVDGQQGLRAMQLIEEVIRLTGTSS